MNTASAGAFATIEIIEGSRLEPVRPCERGGIIAHHYFPHGTKPLSCAGTGAKWRLVGDDGLEPPTPSV
jgi:hypothetical protein